MYTCEDKSGEIFYLRTSFCFPTDSKFTLSKSIKLIDILERIY